MQDVSEEEQRIYNQWLKSYAKVQERAYRKRTDFNNLDDDKKIHLKNISIFIERNHIQNLEFPFEISFEHYKDYVNLDFFITPSAISIYVKALRRVQFRQRNDEELKSEILLNLKFIAKICYEKGVDLDKYCDIIEENQTVPLFIVHLQQSAICPVTLWGFPNFRNKFLSFPSELREFILTSEVEEYILSCERFLNKANIRLYLTEKYNEIQKILK